MVARKRSDGPDGDTVSLGFVGHPDFAVLDTIRRRTPHAHLWRSIGKNQPIRGEKHLESSGIYSLGLMQENKKSHMVNIIVMTRKRRD